MDLEHRFDAVFRKQPEWELEFIFPLRATYESFQLEGESLPGWIGLELSGASEMIKPKLKCVFMHLGFHIVCVYPKGGTTALKNRWIKVRISVPDEPDRVIECKLQTWRKP